MPISKERQKELEDMLTQAESSNPNTDTPQVAQANPPLSQTGPSKTESAVRGTASGLLMGFQPQVWGGIKSGMGILSPFDKAVTEEKKANEAAWQANPVTYGAGYATGTVAPMLTPLGWAGKAAQGANLARESSAALDLGAALSKTQPGRFGQAVEAASGALSNAGGAVKQMFQQPVRTGKDFGRFVPARLGGSGANAVPQTEPELRSETEPSKFDQIRQYLASIQDPKDKFREAMALTTDPSTRNESDST